MEREDTGIPPINKDLLVDYAGWDGWKEGVALAQRGVIRTLEWGEQSLRGELEAGGRRLFPKIEWRRGKLADFSCQCVAGRRGEFCGHLSALLATAMQKPTVISEDEPSVQMEEPPPLRGFRFSAEKGLALSLVIRVAPNWADALGRDKVMVFVEALVNGQQISLEQLDRGRAYQGSPSVEGCLRWLGEWCQGKYASMLQLSTKRLRQLIQQGKGSSDVVWRFADGPLIGAEDPFWSRIEKGVANSVTGQSVNRLHAGVQQVSGSSDVASKPELVEVVLDGSENYLSLRFQPMNAYWKEWALREGMKWEPSNQRFWLRDALQVRPFLARNWQSLRKESRLQEGEHFQRVFGTCQLVYLHAVVEGENQQRQIRFVVKTREGNGVTAEVDWERGVLRSDDARWLLDFSSWERAKILREALQKGAGGVSSTVRSGEEAFWSGEFARHGIALEAPVDWQERSAALLNFSELRPAAIAEGLEEQLRLYQKVGVAWIAHLFRNQLHGILADEMGLGKTIQAIALLTACSKDSSLPQAPWLIVCPASLVPNWMREIQRFAPVLRMGDLASEDPLQQSRDLWIGSYHRVTRCREQLAEMEFGVIVADEAQHIKNADTLNAESLRMLRSRNRLLLTGTPLENRMEDIVSLFRFLMPGYLRMPDKNASAEFKKQWLAQVPARVAPYILRRTRSQVLTELPERVDQTLFTDMTERQTKLYTELEQQTNHEWQSWEKQGGNAGRMRVLSMLTRLRQASVEPRTLQPDWGVEDSAKAGLFAEIVQESIEAGSRMLVFSQFVSVLEIWRRDLAESGIPSCFIHGEVKDRMKEVDRFQQDRSIPVFFLSLKVGGTGFNLTEADKVILVDPWWNPAIEEQAISRAYRMGQKRAVHSMKLIASGTVEERVIRMQQDKRMLLDSLWESSEQEQQSHSWNERLRELLVSL